MYVRDRAEFDVDISSAWYLLASVGQEHVVIDCDPARLGRCHDAFWDVYATADAAVVARSSTDLLAALVEARVEFLPWKQPDFPDLGRAYDGTHDV